MPGRAAPGRVECGCTGESDQPCRVEWVSCGERDGSLVAVDCRRTLIKKPGAVSKKDRSLLNEDIRATSVRLIGPDGSQVGVVTRGEALESARRAGLDLVMIAPEAEPPVVKVMDYGKHLFELKKDKAAQRKKQKQIQIKEIKFRPGTEEGDYQVKLRNLIRFLEEGDKAKISLRFRGREVVHPEIGMQLMTRISQDLDPYGLVEAEPRFEGRQVVMVLAPKKKKKAEKATAGSPQ
jgi:translation initiation factor IF-3